MYFHIYYTLRLLYNNIHAGLNYFRRIYWRLLNDRESIMDIDQDNGEHNFGVIHPAYDSFHTIDTTYQHECTFIYQQALFRDSSKIHAILDFATIDDLDCFETDEETAHGIIRTELRRYVDQWWHFFFKF